jgi:undecaprenyl-diphosphatase|tara:strand:+ start:2229 stop:2987 length:759 start_codon:yes stop_codon:yes gene_type:complete
MFEILILSIIQGITEFLPISSSSHLILISKYLDFNNQNLSIDVSLHIGSFMAVVIYFKNDLFNFFINRKLFIKILLSSIPVMIAGYILVKFDLIEQLRNIKIIGWTTIIFGILLFTSDKSERLKNMKYDFNYKSVFLIGIFQILSLIPGVSRSGITITAARLLKFERVDSAKISFLLSIPTLAAVSIYGINNLFQNEDVNFSLINLLSIFLSFIFSLITIKYFLKYIKTFSLNIFVAYRILLGIIILIFAYL